MADEWAEQAAIFLRKYGKYDGLLHDMMGAVSTRAAERLEEKPPPSDYTEQYYTHSVALGNWVDAVKSLADMRPYYREYGADRPTPDNLIEASPSGLSGRLGKDVPYNKLAHQSFRASKEDPYTRGDVLAKGEGIITESIRIMSEDPDRNSELIIQAEQMKREFVALQSLIVEASEPSLGAKVLAAKQATSTAEPVQR